jgi:outer membrane protein TolC
MKRFIFALTLAGVAFLPFIAPRNARADIQSISEIKILRAAMQNSSDYQAVFKSAADEKADAKQEGRLKNPTVDLKSIQTSGPADDIQSFDIEIEQPMKLSQLTGARNMLSNTLYDRAELRERHGILQAYWSIKTLYVRAWQAQEQVKLYTDFQKRAQNISDKIDKSVKAGQTPISEGSLFAGDAAKFGSDLEKIKADSIQLRLQLEKATGLNLSDVVLEKPVLPAVERDISVLESKAYQNASLVRLLETDLRVANQQKNAALADSALPEIAPRFIYGRNPDENMDSVGFGVVLTIPLWDRNQSERQKADASRLYAQRQLDTLQNLPLSERLVRIVNTVALLDSRILALNDEALPNYRKGYRQAQKSFNAGQTDAAALWQIRERLFETEQQALGAVLESIEARRILSLETGIIPQEVTP